MAEDSSKIPVSTDESAPSGLRPRRSLESLRQGIDRLFDDFGIGTWRPSFRGSFFDVDPLRRAKAAFSGMPAVDISETGLSILDGPVPLDEHFACAGASFHARVCNRTHRVFLLRGVLAEMTLPIRPPPGRSRGKQA